MTVELAKTSFEYFSYVFPTFSSILYKPDESVQDRIIRYALIFFTRSILIPGVIIYDLSRHLYIAVQSSLSEKLPAPLSPPISPHNSGCPTFSPRTLRQRPVPHSPPPVHPPAPAGQLVVHQGTDGLSSRVRENLLYYSRLIVFCSFATLIILGRIYQFRQNLPPSTE